MDAGSSAGLSNISDDFNLIGSDGKNYNDSAMAQVAGCPALADIDGQTSEGCQAFQIPNGASVTQVQFGSSTNVNGQEQNSSGAWAVP